MMIFLKRQAPPTSLVAILLLLFVNSGFALLDHKNKIKSSSRTTEQEEAGGESRLVKVEHETISYNFKVKAFYTWPDEFDFTGSRSVTAISKQTVRLAQTFYRKLMMEEYPLAYEMVKCKYIGSSGNIKTVPYTTEVDFSAVVTFRINDGYKTPTENHAMSFISSIDADPAWDDLTANVLQTSDLHVLVESTGSEKGSATSYKASSSFRSEL